MSPRSETPDTVHGRLLESVHISGYSFERACDELNWLLIDDRWKVVGPGYQDVNDFVATIDFSEFRIAMEQRRGIAAKLRAIGASQRATAKALGVGQKTVSRDLQPESHDSKEDAETVSGPRASESHDSPAPFQSTSAEVAKAARDKVAKAGRRAGREAEREAMRDQALEQEREGETSIRLGDFATALADVEPGSASLFFTDPPYDRASIPLYGRLAEFAAEKLRPGGSLLAYCGQYAVPEIANLMTPYLEWHWMLGCYHRDGNHKSLPGVSVYVTWKPILWFVKPPFKRLPEFVVDMVDRPLPDKSAHDWSQSLVDATYYIEKLTQPGELVLDPFAGGGTTLIAASKLGRPALGAEVDEAVRLTALGRLTA